MPATTPVSNYHWLPTGREFFEAMLAAIEMATSSVCLETYIFRAGPPGDQVLAALVDARRRGVRVRVLLDALGSYNLSAVFWAPLLSKGGEVRWFNPLSLNRFGIRNHRKLLVCDGNLGIIGGFNIAQEYQGDGVMSGWCDLGLRIKGGLAWQLEVSFAEMFKNAQFQHQRFMRFRKRKPAPFSKIPGAQLLASGPGRGRNPLKRALKRDLASGRSVQIIAGYFLPTWRVRRQLAHVVQRGGQVDLILAGKSDVPLCHQAGQSLYHRLLKQKVNIYEYQPQVLHAKLMIIDDVVYVGSANLDQRSLNINYEFMVRLEGREMAGQAKALFAMHLKNSRLISSKEWARSRSFLRWIKECWAYFLLVHVDPSIARSQWRDMRR